LSSCNTTVNPFPSEYFSTLIEKAASLSFDLHGSKKANTKINDSKMYFFIGKNLKIS
jgi:hypothetical protein